MAQEPRVFFQEQKDQSLVKAQIVSKYFDAWSKVMISNHAKFGRFNVIAYIDLFCGPGRYEDGSKSTPVMVLEQAIANPELSKMLVSMFNDKDEANIKSLQTTIEAIPGIKTLGYEPIIQCSEVNQDAQEMFEKTNLCPTFSFVDPFGYKGLSSAFIKSIMKDWGCDCVFFFNYGRINAGINNPLVSKHMDALFGKNRTESMRGYVKDKKPHQREIYILEELAEALKEMGAKFVLPFRFKRPNGHQTSHALIFVTKNFLGYEIMKSIMAKESSTEDEGVASFAYSPAEEATPLLFSLAQPLAKLHNSLLKNFSGRTISMHDIYMEHNVDTPYIKKNYKTVLNDLEKDGKISCDKPMAKRPMRLGERTFSDNTQVKFPKWEK